MKTPRDNGTEMTALHNRILGAAPRLFFYAFLGQRRRKNAVNRAQGCAVTHPRCQELKMRLPAALLALVLALAAPGSPLAQTAPLVIDGKIPLGLVTGRIDHMAVDLKRQLLLVAELGNDTLGVVNIAAGKTRSTDFGFKEPQGVAYEPSTDTVYVANAGDGSVRVLRAEDLTFLQRIDLGEDADNVRLDRARNRVLVGYGNGAIAAMDLKSRARGADIRLKAHPESFQIDEAGGRAFVNVPAAQAIEVIDLAKAEVVETLPTQGHHGNFPMAIDQDAHRVFIAFRNPPRLMALSASDGAVVADLDTCGDADDLFVDTKRKRVYVICGTGQVDVFEKSGDGYQRITHLGTAPGARTGLFVPELDRLFVAVRAAGKEPAAIWVLRPTR